MRCRSWPVAWLVWQCRLHVTAPVAGCMSLHSMQALCDCTSVPAQLYTDLTQLSRLGNTRLCRMLPDNGPQLSHKQHCLANSTQKPPLTAFHRLHFLAGQLAGPLPFVPTALVGQWTVMLRKDGVPLCVTTRSCTRTTRSWPAGWSIRASAWWTRQMTRRHCTSCGPSATSWPSRLAG
jgi:hypothetical protein